MDYAGRYDMEEEKGPLSPATKSNYCSDRCRLKIH
jgi:hypothetical protein